MRCVRAAVYTDAVLRRTAGGYSASETFVVFVADLRDHVDRLVLVGRVAPEPGEDAHPVRDDVDVVGLPHYGSLADPPAVLRSVAASLRRFHRALDDVDVVWLLGPHPLALLFTMVAVVRQRRVVLGVRQDMPAHMRARHPERRSIRAAGVVLEGAWRALARWMPTVVVGPDLARRYRHARRLLPVVVSLVDDGEVVGDEAASQWSADGELRLLSVGRLDPEKNPLLLADIIVGLRALDRRWRLVVCGDGAMRDALAARLDALGVAAHADLLGFRPLHELHRWYRDSHALVHVSWTEGVPQVLFEAFAAGLPVVATDVGGVAAAAGDAALLVPPGDAGAAVRAVGRLARNDTLRRALVHRGVAVARAHTGDAERRRLAAFLSGKDRRGHGS